MKKLLFLIMILQTINGYSQQSKYLAQQDIVKRKINTINDSINKHEFPNDNRDYLVVNMSLFLPSDGSESFVIPKGDTIFIRNYSKFTVTYNNVSGKMCSYKSIQQLPYDSFHDEIAVKRFQFKKQVLQKALDSLKLLVYELNENEALEETKQEQYRQRKANHLREAEAQKLHNLHNLKIGMSDSNVLELCGSPNKTNKTVTLKGTSTQWCYTTAYLYFTDGILISYQLEE